MGNTYANTETVSVEHVLGEEVSFNSEKAIYQKTCQREGCGTAIYFADSKGLYAAEEDAEGAFTTDTYVLQDATEYVNQAVCTAKEVIYTRTVPTTNWSSWYVPFELTLTEEICSKYKFSRISNVHQYDTNNDGNADKREQDNRERIGTLHAAHFGLGMRNRGNRDGEQLAARHHVRDSGLQASAYHKNANEQGNHRNRNVSHDGAPP